jgi:PD-(D/E)XK nuclease superfamily
MVDFKPLLGRSLFRKKQPSVWQFYRHGITSSLLSRFLECREQTRLLYVNGLQSRHVSMAIEFGTCCHWILEQAYGQIIRNNKSGHPVVPPQSWVDHAVKTYEGIWISRVEAPTEFQLKQQEHVYALAEAVLPEYFKRWGSDFSGKNAVGISNGVTVVAKWESLEALFNVPYKFFDGVSVPIRGRRDGTFRDKNGKLWVFDTKCRSVISDNDILDTMAVDLQQMLYLWVTWKETGEIPSGYVLNVIRRPGQRLATYSSLKELVAKVRSEIAKKPDYYFIRYQCVIAASEIRNWEKQILVPLMRDVRNWWDGNAPHYMNPLALISKYGRCGMFKAITQGDMSDCYKREIAFPELPEV